jgi:hypothetical protein
MGRLPPLRWSCSFCSLCLWSASRAAAASAAPPACTVQAAPTGRPVNPLLFGINDILGPIINLTYSDSALQAAVSALGVGALRHPGGTVANYWTMANGSYVGDGGTSPGCSGQHWNYCKYEERIAHHPPRTFSAQRFAEGVGSVVRATVHDLNVLTMTTSQSIAELHALAEAGVVVTHLELGNEFYIGKHYEWRFPTAASYAAACAPVVAAARQIWPHAKIAVVAAFSGAWNVNLSKQTALINSVDAVTMHHYGPKPDDVLALPAEQRRSALAADGEIVSASMAAQIRDTFAKRGPSLALWRTEYNYPGAWVGSLPPPYQPMSGMHALFMAGHLLSALAHEPWAVPFEVLMMHCLAHQPSAGWTSTNSTLLIVGDGPDEADAVQVGEQ